MTYEINFCILLLILINHKLLTLLYDIINKIIVIFVKLHVNKPKTLLLLKYLYFLQVDLCIEPGQSLGLMIRGGLEYNLGIYITGVDKDSVADRAGLMVSS